MPRKLRSAEVLFTLIDKYTFVLLYKLIFSHKQMPEILIITEKICFNRWSIL